MKIYWGLSKTLVTKWENDHHYCTKGPLLTFIVHGEPVVWQGLVCIAQQIHYILTKSHDFHGCVHHQIETSPTKIPCFLESTMQEKTFW